MAFRFQWPEFSEVFIHRVRGELEQALNRGAKPSNICDTIRVKDLHMGSQPPELDILEIGELSEERFRGIFKLTYSGDANVILHTCVQANPLSLTTRPVWDSLLGPAMLAADAPLIVPLELRISQVRLRGIFVLIVSLTRGVTVSFKNDPLESILVSSTFDNLPSIREHLQREIEQSVCDLLRKELPLLIHQLSIERVRLFAEHIPAPFKSSAPPLGYFRNRQSKPDSVPAAPSRSHSHSPLDSVSTGSVAGERISFDEVYYFRRNSMIHRTTSIHSICDPLAGPVIEDLQTRPSLLQDLTALVERLPFFGSDAKDFVDWLLPAHQSLPATPGLKDWILFSDRVSSNPASPPGHPTFCAQTIVINSGAVQLNLSQKTCQGLLSHHHSPDAAILRPSVYKAPRSGTGKFGEAAGGLDTSQLDPEEFRSMDSLPLVSLDKHRAQSTAIVLTATTAVFSSPSLPKPSGYGRRAGTAAAGTVASLAPAALIRTVTRSSLNSRLGILRSLHENPSPFSLYADCHVVHRSKPLAPSSLSPSPSPSPSLSPSASISHLVPPAS